MSMNLFIFFVFTFISMGLLNATLEGSVSLATTVLTAAVDDDDTTINVQSTQGFPATDSVIVLDDEMLCYSTLTSTTFVLSSTSNRGCRGTDVASHAQANGSRSRDVYSMAPGVINALVGFDIASAFSDGGFFGTIKGFYNSVKEAPKFLQAVAKMIAWDYAFLEGPYVYVKYLMLYPLSAGMVLGFVRMAFNR